MGNVMTLKVREQVHQDCTPLALMYRNLGPASTEQIIARAMGELALAMAGIAAQVKEHQLTDVARQLTRLQRMAENLGLVSLSAVSGDAKACLEGADSTAFAAVWARLLRVAERSLSAETAFADLSG
jgi:hypothetical protein